MIRKFISPLLLAWLASASLSRASEHSLKDSANAPVPAAPAKKYATWLTELAALRSVKPIPSFASNDSPDKPAPQDWPRNLDIRYADAIKYYGIEIPSPEAQKDSQKIEIRYIDENWGYGVFAKEPIKAGEAIGIYSGEFAPSVNASQYAFQLDDEKIFCIDAARMGNRTRFINHSFSPNITIIRIRVGVGSCAIPLLRANRDIKVGEQLFIDYGMKYWMVSGKKFINPDGSVNAYLFDNAEYGLVSLSKDGVFEYDIDKVKIHGVADFSVFAKFESAPLGYCLIVAKLTMKDNDRKVYVSILQKESRVTTFANRNLMMYDTFSFSHEFENDYYNYEDFRGAVLNYSLALSSDFMEFSNKPDALPEIKKMILAIWQRFSQEYDFEHAFINEKLNFNYVEKLNGAANVKELVLYMERLWKEHRKLPSSH